MTMLGKKYYHNIAKLGFQFLLKINITVVINLVLGVFYEA